MESVDIDWTLVEDYKLEEYQIRLYHGLDDDKWDVYRYEVEDLSGWIEDPAEPFPFLSLEECREAAQEDVSWMKEEAFQNYLENYGEGKDPN